MEIFIMNRFVKVNLLLLVVSFVLFGQANTSTRFKFVSHTGASHTIGIPANVTILVKQNANATTPLTPISVGDEIAAFWKNPATGEFLCVGATIWQGASTSIIAWKDDDRTSVIDGFQTGKNDRIYFKVYVNKAKYESFAEATLSLPPGVTSGNPNEFKDGGLSLLTRLEAAATIDVGDLPTPESYTLSQNYPNPFNPTTKISYTIPKSAYVTLTIFDLNGKEITRLLDNTVSNLGTNYVEWNGKNAKGITASSGVYFYKIEARSMETGKTDFLQVKSMILMK